MPKRIRKRVDELTAQDFEDFPGWQYAIDEEGDDENEDETMVRPMTLASVLCTRDLALIQAAFFFPNGRVRLGAVTLNGDESVSGTQPMLLLPDGPLLFYNGALRPSPADVLRFGKRLRKIAPKPLPIHFASALCRKDEVPLVSGVLKGLYWLANWKTGKLCLVR